jgi:hypothetical protein
MIMKNLVFVILLVAWAVGNSCGQVPFARRQVLFTLEEHEELSYGEYYVLQRSSGDRFACIVHDTEASGHYMYGFHDGEQARVVVNVDGEERVSRAYDLIDCSRLTVGGQYAFRYRDGDRQGVHVNGRDVEGFAHVENLRLTDDDGVRFLHARRDGNVYEWHDGNERETGLRAGMNSALSGYTPFGNTNPFASDEHTLELVSPDGRHSLISSFKEESVVIDGRRYGKAPALYAWYDRGTFVWNAVEGRELVVYSYALD